MIITKNYIDVNPYSRCGDKLDDIKAVVIHWPANPKQPASGVRQWFQDAPKRQSYGSTQYVVGLSGEVLQLMDENEVSYNAGSSKPDPASGKIYTDLARKMFGTKYTNPKSYRNVNYLTIGIETCHIDWTGKFTEVTLTALAELVADIFKRNSTKLTDPMTQIVTHNLIVGWKDCPKWFVDCPEELDNFRKRVVALLSPPVP